MFEDIILVYEMILTEKAIVDPFKKDWEKPPDTDEFKRTKARAKVRDHERRYKEAGRVKKFFMKTPRSQKKPKYDRNPGGRYPSWWDPR
jgi:hypothetical protein